MYWINSLLRKRKKRRSLCFKTLKNCVSKHQDRLQLCCTKMFLPHPLVKLSIVVSLRDREVASSASDLQGLNFESCVWRAVSSHSSHHPQEVLLAQFSLYVHKSGLKPDSFHFYRVCIRSELDICSCDTNFFKSYLTSSRFHLAKIM